MPFWTLTFAPTGEPARIFREEAPEAIAPPELLAHIAEVFGPSQHLESRHGRVTAAAAFIEWPPAASAGGSPTQRQGAAVT